MLLPKAVFFSKLSCIMLLPKSGLRGPYVHPRVADDWTGYLTMSSRMIPNICHYLAFLILSKHSIPESRCYAMKQSIGNWTTNNPRSHGFFKINHVRICIDSAIIIYEN